MKKTLLAILIFSALVFASYERFDTAKRPAVGSQQVIPEYQSFTTPAATTTNGVLAATNNSSTSASKVVTAGITSPDVPRNLTVVTGGSTGDCAAGNVTVVGTDALGRALSENIAIVVNQNGTSTGAKAFRTVSSISLPAEQTTHNCTFAVGAGSSLGLNRCLNFPGDVGHATYGGIKETTAPAISANSSAVSGNLVKLNSSVDGAHSVQILYYQNYRCLP